MDTITKDEKVEQPYSLHKYQYQIEEDILSIIKIECQRKIAVLKIAVITIMILIVR